MKTFKNVVLTLAVIFLAGSLSAQTDNESSHTVGVDWGSIALLEVKEPAGNVNITFDLSGLDLNIDAGDAIENTSLDSNTNLSLHYTIFDPSNQGASGDDYQVTVDVDGVPGDGWDIDITPSSLNIAGPAPGAASTLTPISMRDATSSAQTLLGGIGSIGWTGPTAGSDGYELKFDLKITDISNFDAGSSTTSSTVTYTLATP